MRFRQVAKTCLFIACAARAGSDDSFVNSIVFASSPANRSLAAAWRPLWARRLQIDILRGHFCDRGGANPPSKSKSSREVGYPKMRNCRRFHIRPVELPSQALRPRGRPQRKQQRIPGKLTRKTSFWCLLLWRTMTNSVQSCKMLWSID